MITEGSKPKQGSVACLVGIWGPLVAGLLGRCWIPTQNSSRLLTPSRKSLTARCQRMRTVTDAGPGGGPAKGTADWGQEGRLFPDTLTSDATFLPLVKDKDFAQSFCIARNTQERCIWQLGSRTGVISERSHSPQFPGKQCYSQICSNFLFSVWHESHSGL